MHHRSPTPVCLAKGVGDLESGGDSATTSGGGKRQPMSHSRAQDQDDDASTPHSPFAAKVKAIGPTRRGGADASTRVAPTTRGSTHCTARCLTWRRRYRHSDDGAKPATFCPSPKGNARRSV